MGMCAIVWSYSAEWSDKSFHALQCVLFHNVVEITFLGCAVWHGLICQCQKIKCHNKVFLTLTCIALRKVGTSINSIRSYTLWGQHTLFLLSGGMRKPKLRNAAADHVLHLYTSNLGSALLQTFIFHHLLLLILPRSQHCPFECGFSLILVPDHLQIFCFLTSLIL